jgi:hypothetical protein
MTQDTAIRPNSLAADAASAESAPCQGEAVAALLDGMDNKLDAIAANLYNVASMLIGEGDVAVTLVEEALSSPEAAGCCDEAAMLKKSRKALCAAGVRALTARKPGSMDAPQGIAPMENCIDDDDLAAAGVPAELLEKMISGPDRGHLQSWLSGLPAIERAIFVLRAVVGLCAANSAKLLAANGGPAAQGWTQDGVRQILRQALCSLATHLIRG